MLSAMLRIAQREIVEEVGIDNIRSTPKLMPAASASSLEKPTRNWRRSVPRSSAMRAFCTLASPSSFENTGQQHKPLNHWGLLPFTEI